MKLIDTHVHLNDKDLYSERFELVKKANLLGVEKMIVIGFDLESSKQAIDIAHEFECCYAAIGIHPEELLKMNSGDLKEIDKLANDSKVVAIGEIGYELHWDDVPVEVQEKFFKEQILIAKNHNLPIIVHSRDAIERTLKTLKEEKNNLINGGIMHCYAAPKELVKDYIDLGFYISFGGPLTFKNARVPKEAITAVPLNKLLFETDSPYLAPHPLRGTRNEPANIVYVLKEAANILNMSEEELSNIEYENAMRFINICKK